MAPHHRPATIADLNEQLTVALIAGDDTAPIRARLAVLRAEAEAAASTAAHAAADLQADAERALAADAASRVAASRDALAARLAQLQPPLPPAAKGGPATK